MPKITVSGITLDETENEFRFRVRPPGNFIEGTFRRKNIASGVDFVLGRMKESKRPKSVKAGSMVVQAVRLKKPEFSAKRAAKWVKDHKDDF